MHTLILTIHITACFLLIITVLLQSGKGSAAGIFGGGGGGDMLFAASSGTSFIKRFTIGLAIVIACTSLLLTKQANQIRLTSVADRYNGAPQPAGMPAPKPGAAAQPQQAAQTPAQPAAPAPTQQVPAKK